MKHWFILRGELSKKERSLIFTGGVIGILLVWLAVTSLDLIDTKKIPGPFEVISGMVFLLKGPFFPNFLVSLKMNLLGYLEAVAIALPLGFLIGLFPFFDALCGPWLKAIRFLPLTATLVVFMAVFGIYTNMKVQFLAFTILVYLIPAVAQRIHEVPENLVRKMKTLGGNKWQIIRHVFIPQACGSSWDDITNLVAISWTYIIFVEMINKLQGGVGALIHNVYFREHKTEQLWGILILLLIFGVLQDRLFRLIDFLIFRFKYRKEA